MNRRDLLQRTAVLIGGSLMGADSLIAKNINWAAIEAEDDARGIGLFSKAQIKLLNEVGNTIIPDTDTPGAKAAKVGQFIAVIVSDCYEPEDQKRFMEGLVTLDAESKKRYGKTFLKLDGMKRNDFLNELDREQKAAEKTRTKGQPVHYFRKIKDLVLWGYFTSEIGATQALRMVEYPGKYTTIDYKRGDRNFGGY
ncbi:MAG: gluconate 2-dehydrogenase subunit 3 family protein [Saprospiraceae bacterium]|nr:gluconate 2-dehydrogenase subunit 3 family protein [Saprospiraceae bacterium]